LLVLHLIILVLTGCCCCCSSPSLSFIISSWLFDMDNELSLLLFKSLIWLLVLIEDVYIDKKRIFTKKKIEQKKNERPLFHRLVKQFSLYQPLIHLYLKFQISSLFPWKQKNSTLYKNLDRTEEREREDSFRNNYRYFI
jgi:hypothetical protein